MNDLKRERVITVTAVDGANELEIDIPTAAVPLKVTPDQILDYARGQNPNARPLRVRIEFDSEAGAFVHGFNGEFGDDEWREEIVADYASPIDLGEDGDAVEIYSQYRNRIYTVDYRGVAS